jgi:hypothetical protein
MRRQLSLRSDTCTERMDVDAVGISVKVGVYYPGCSVSLPWATLRLDILGSQKHWAGVGVK